jgi:hypothetical protein
MDVSHRKRNCGRKPKDWSNQLATMPNVPLSRRGTIRSTAAALGIPKSSFGRIMKDNGIRAHSSAIKPQLTDSGKKNVWIIV